MKKEKTLIPGYDLQVIDPGRLHQDVSAGPLSHYYDIGEKIVIPHRNNFYQLVMVTRGSGTKIIDFEEFDIHPGQIFFIAPGQLHYWKFNNKPEGYSINFSNKVFRSHMSSQFYLEQFIFLRGVPGNSVIDLKKATLREIRYFIKRIISEVRKKDTFSMDIICFNLISMFISITRKNKLAVNKQIPEQNQLTLYNFRILVNQYYTEKRLPKDYAAMLYITPNQLNSVCKDLTGVSAGNIIRERIVLEARRLLTNADISISEVAYRLNFSDNSYFTKFFKKYTGQTPEEFRK